MVDGLEVHIVAEKTIILDCGMGSDRKRLLRIGMKYSYGVQKVKFIPLEKPTHHRADDMAYDHQEKQDFIDILSNTDILPENRVTYFSGTLKFTDLDPPAFDKSNLRIELDIGNIS